MRKLGLFSIHYTPSPNMLFKVCDKLSMRRRMNLKMGTLD
jgi:hypothetical protein